MSELMEWQSDEITNLVGAILTAQLKMGPAVKDQRNPFYNSKYADLSSVWHALIPFRECGIAITQSPMESPDGYIVLDTQLSHTSGEWMRSRLKMRVAKDDPQGAGSALTYARRYALGCMTGLVTEEDDDGNAGSYAPQKPAQAFQQQKRTAQAKLAELRTYPILQDEILQQPQEPVGGSMVGEAGPIVQEEPSNEPPAAFIWRMKPHVGESIVTIPDGYLIWAEKTVKFADHREAATAELDRRKAHNIVVEG